ncbi:MAG: glycosyltransferase family 9 protein [Flavobacteriales bacterium]|nr:glycosyltransferase family 9 protein [Flavobacteriales bacterium]
MVQPAFLGDAVLATSLLESIKRRWPSALLSVLVREEAAPLFDGHPFLERVWSWDRKSGGVLGKYGRLLKLVRAVRKSRYDVVINVHRHGSSALLTLCSGATTVGFTASPAGRLWSHRIQHVWGDGTHEIERNAALLAPLDCTTAPCRPKLYPPSMAPSTAGSIVLAPASVWRTKMWPLEKWAALAVELADLWPERELIWVGGPSDRALLEHIANELCAKSGALRSLDSLNMRVVAGEYSLLETAGVMAVAALVISGDSAPLHLASGVNARALGVFCSTTEAFGFGPTSDFSAVVEVKPEELVCKPCGMHGRKACPLRHFKCGEQLEVDRVLVAAQQLLAN